MSASPSPGYLSDQDRGPSLRAFCIVMMTVAFVSVSLRFYCRLSNRRQRHVGMRLWWDDWFCLLSLPFVLGSESCVIAMIHLGFGKHIWNVNPENIPTILKPLFSTEIVYDTGLALCRASALLFYTRIFTPKFSPKWITVSVYVVHAMNVAWWTDLKIGTPLTCRPVAKNWDVTLPGTCNPEIDLWLGSGIPNVVIDVCTLLLPLPRIWSLQISRGRKASLLAVFVCGYSVVVMSIGRLVTTVQEKDELDKDLTFVSIPVLYWLAAETPIALLSICLPATADIATRLAAQFASIRSMQSCETEIGTITSAHKHASVGVRNDQLNNESYFYSASAEYAPEDLEDHGGLVASNQIHVENSYTISRRG